MTLTVSRIPLSLLALALLATPALAQPEAPEVEKSAAGAGGLRTVSGVVLDAVTGEPVAGLSVYLAETGDVAVTDGAGRFTLAGIAPGSRQLVAVDPAYRRATLRVAVAARAGATPPVEIHVAPIELRGSEVVVEVERRRKAAGQATLEREEITKVPGTRGDLLQVVRSLPGVANTGGFGPDAGLVIRGSSPADSRIFVDGWEVPILYHFSGFQSVIPSEMIDTLTYTPGGFGVEYGNASAGIVELTTRGGSSETHASGEISFVNGAALAQGPIGDRGDFSVGFRRSYIDALIPLVVPENDLSFTTLPRYYDYQARGEYRLNDHLSLETFVFGSDDSLAITTAESNTIDPVQGNRFKNATRFTYGIAAARYDDGAARNRFSVMVGNQHKLLEVGDDRHLETSVTEVGVRDHGRFELGRRLAVIGGGQLDQHFADVDIHMPRPPREGDPADPSFSYDPQIDEQQRNDWLDSSAWGTLELAPLGPLDVTAGVRADYFGRNEKLVVQPRTQARADLDEATAVLASVGLYSRPPDNLDENLQSTDIGPEKSIQYSLGGQRRIGEALEIQSTAFYLDRSDLIVYAGGDRRSTPEGSAAGTYDNAGTGRTYGLESMIRYHDDHFFGWISYTLSRSERRDHPMDELRLFDHDQTHNVIVVGSYKLGPWQLGGRFQYTSGSPYTPVEGATFISDQNRYQPSFGAVNSLREKAAHQLDLRVDRSFDFDAWKLSVYLDVSNVYMNAPIVDHQYNYDYSERTAVTGLPILPSFGVRGEI